MRMPHRRSTPGYRPGRGLRRSAFDRALSRIDARVHLATIETDVSRHQSLELRRAQCARLSRASRIATRRRGGLQSLLCDRGSDFPSPELVERNARIRSVDLSLAHDAGSDLGRRCGWIHEKELVPANEGIAKQQKVGLLALVRHQHIVLHLL